MVGWVGWVGWVSDRLGRVDWQQIDTRCLATCMPQILAANNVTAPDAGTQATIKRQAARQRLNDFIKTLPFVGVTEGDVIAVGHMLRRCMRRNGLLPTIQRSGLGQVLHESVKSPAPPRSKRPPALGHRKGYPRGGYSPVGPRTLNRG
jgi:hypothetical protein